MTSLLSKRLSVIWDLRHENEVRERIYTCRSHHFGQSEFVKQIGTLLFNFLETSQK